MFGTCAQLERLVLGTFNILFFRSILRYRPTNRFETLKCYIVTLIVVDVTHSDVCVCLVSGRSGEAYLFILPMCVVRRKTKRLAQEISLKIMELLEGVCTVTAQLEVRQR